MSERKTLKSVHLAGTVWFIVCVVYILVLALRQAGIKWWVVFSLSGQGVLVVLLLISLYLFAIYRGISSSQKVQIEHPLTSTSYYAAFYVTTPLLGGLAGCLGMIGISTINQLVLGIALGTLGTTFLVWVIIDPLAGLLEMLVLPASRKHCAERLARAKALRQSRQRNRELLLTEVLAKAESEQGHWREVLKPKAEKLAGLLTTVEAPHLRVGNGNHTREYVEVRIDFRQSAGCLTAVEREAVGIGVDAWQIGGLACMRELHDMAIAIAGQRNQNESVVDYVGAWWDGIGSWREPSLG
jgi:hypothetical protein